MGWVCSWNSSTSLTSSLQSGDGYGCDSGLGKGRGEGEEGVPAEGTAVLGVNFRGGGGE